MRAYAIALIMCLAGTCPSLAHDQWSNDTPIPAWVKSACCGPSDAHVIDSGDVSGPDKDGLYHVDGVREPVRPERVFDSQDGETWAFFNADLPPNERFVFCLFLVRSF